MGLAAAYLLAGAVGGSYFPLVPWLGIICGLIGLFVSNVFAAGDDMPHPLMFLAYWASASMFLQPYNHAFLMSALAGWGYGLLTTESAFVLLKEGFSFCGASRRLENGLYLLNPLALLFRRSPEQARKGINIIHTVVCVGSCVYMLELIARALQG